MPHLMAQVSFPYFTNLPKDVSVNTFHFDAPDAEPATALEIIELLTDFYTLTASPAPNAVAHYLSSVITTAAQSIRFKIYDMSQPRPRVPIVEEGDILPAPLASTSMPLEVAVCISFAAERDPGTPPGRRRGRIFLGPLNSSALNLGNSSTFPYIHDIARNTFREASRRLAVDSRAAEIPWCVYSRVMNDLAPVYRGWIDNEPDTQRRRQPDATDRTTWTLSV